MKFKIEQVGNMVFIATEDEVWKAWHESEVTERKIKNAVAKIKSNFQKEVEFVDLRK